MAKPRILTVSSANIDFMARMPTIPSAGQTLKCEDGYEYIPGGKGANSALAVQRLGGDSVFCAKLGSDTHGARLANIYSEAGINTRFVTADKRERTGLALVMVEANGNNRIVAYPGANRRLAPTDVEYALTCYPDAMILQFEIPTETVLSAASYAREAGVPIIVDAGPAVKNFPLEELGPVEIFSPNETEAYAYTGIHPTTPEKCLKTCMALSQRIKAKYYVLKLGERGVYLYDGTFFRVIAPYNVDAVDTTAAGDVFTAALTLEYIRSGDIRRACEYANIAGAITVTREGAFTSVPTVEEMQNFVIDNGIGFQI